MPESNLVCSVSLTGYRPIVWSGIPVHLRYSQLRKTLAERLGGDFPEFLAQPTISNEALSGNTPALWFSGWVENVTPFSQLDAEGQYRAGQRLHAMLEQIDGLCREMAESDDPEHRQTADMLRIAVEVPNLDFVCVDGDKICLAGWGFTPEDDRAQSIFMLAKKIASTPPVQPQVPTPPPPVTPPVPEPVSEPEPEPKKKKSLWWLWLLLLLLLLALLGFLAWWFWPTSGTLDVQVRDARVLSPVRDAQVHVTGPQTDRTGVTNVLGLAGFPNLERGEYQINASHEMYHPTTQTRPCCGSVEEILLNPLPEPLAVTVLDERDNSPIEGAVVVVGADGTPIYELTTDENGIAAFGNLPDDATITIDVTAEGYLAHHEDQPCCTDVTILMKSSMGEQVIVLKNPSTGEPIANATVTLVFEDGETIELESDSQGRVVFPEVPVDKPFTIRVDADGYNSYDSGAEDTPGDTSMFDPFASGRMVASLSMAAGSFPILPAMAASSYTCCDEIMIELEPSEGRQTIVIKDPNTGEPIEGAVVTLTFEDGETMEAETDGQGIAVFERVPLDRPFRVTVEADGFRLYDSGEPGDGSSCLDPLEDGVLVASLGLSAGSFPILPGMAMQGASTCCDEIVIELIPAVNQQVVTVKDASTDQPIEGATVNMDPDFGHLERLTDSQGVAIFESVPEHAEFEVTAAMDGYQSETVEHTCCDDLVIYLEPGACEMSFHVYDKDTGAPIPGATVTVTWANGSASGETDGDGNVTIDGIPENVFVTVETAAADYRAEPVTVQSCEDQDIPMERLQGLSGEVRINLRWTSIDDLDLIVLDPCGNKIWRGHTGYYCGNAVGNMDVDANYGDNMNPENPEENIFWEGDAPPGQYQVYVVWFSRNGGFSQRVDFTIHVEHQGTVEEETRTVYTLDNGDTLRNEFRVLTFTVGQ